MKKLIALMLALVMLLTLAACGKNASETNDDANAASQSSDTETPDAAKPDYERTAIFENQALAFMNVSLFTLKPVAFSNGNSKVKGYAFYLQCDVTANEGNGLGFSAGEWVPNLKIEFELIGEDGKVAANGELMPMNASDGPCYGSNVKLKDAGDYAVHLVVRNPETSGHFIITDEKVGPEKTFADWFGAGNLEIRYEGWTYAPTK